MKKMAQNMEKFETGRKEYEYYLLGKHFDPNTEDGRKIVNSVEMVAENCRGTNPVSTGFESPSLPIWAEAMAYRTPGTHQYREPDVKDKILRDLSELKKYYYPEKDRGEQEHWWIVQVGDPLRILDILVLMYEELPDRDEEIRRWTDTILSFQDAYGKSSHGRMETGANLMWKCHVYILAGILRGEQELVDQGNEWLSGMMRYSHRISHPQAGSFYDDGFYPDGSFIQHYFFAYTGGYGKHMLCIFAGLVYAFYRCGLLTLKEEEIDFFCRAVQKSYLPLLVNGRFMDIARGREISRCNCEDVICGRMVMRALCFFTDALPREKAAPIRMALKQQLAFGNNREKICCDEDAFAEHYVMPGMEEVLARLDEEILPEYSPVKEHFVFGPMAKVVHRHGNWSAAVGMFSPFIACYEMLGRECAGFWHISDGALYLYSGSTDQFSGDYHAAVDPMRFPGTTVDRDPDRASAPQYSWYMPDSKNPCAFAGGAALGEYGSAGLEYLGQGKGKERSLKVKKSWFFLGDEIICMGSGISSATGDEVETTVMNRRLMPEAENLLTVNETSYICRELEGGLEEKNRSCGNVATDKADKTGTVRMLHLTDDCGSGTGVVFPCGGDVRILCEHRRGTWNSVTVEPGNIKENDFATVWISHGRNPENACYTYIILPETDAERTKAYTDAPDCEILECSGKVHAVRNRVTGLTGMNFWKEENACCSGIKANTQACVIIKEEEKEITLAVSDPTMQDRQIELELPWDADGIIRADREIEIISLAPLRVKADTTGCDGRSICMTAEKR